MRFTRILIAAVLLTIGTAAMAETTIAVLSPEGVLLRSNLAKDFNAQMERDFKSRRDSLKAKAESIKKMQEDGQREADFMSDDQKRELAAKYTAAVREFQTMQNELAKDQSAREQEFLQSVRPKLDAVVNRIVESRGIDLLVDRRSVLFAKAGTNLDISQEVLDGLNSGQ